MAGSANNILIQPVNVLWQIEAQYQFDTANLSDPDGTYFTMYNAKDETQYYVWFNLDAGSADPAPGGMDPIEVAVTTGDSPSVIASAMATAIDAIGDFTAGASGSDSLVDVKLSAIGTASDPADVDSGVGIAVCRRGKDFDLGLLEGDVELNLAPANFIVQAHQSGVTPRAALFQGIETAEVSTVMQETQTSKLSEIYGLYGSTGFLPPGGDSVFGAGTSKQGENLLIDAAKLILRPVNAVDATTDTTLMLAIPIPDTLVFSGENPKTLACTWQGFVDDAQDTRINVVTFGNASSSNLDA